MKKLSITPLETLGLPNRTVCVLVRHQINSVEAFSCLTPEKVRQMLPYCDAMYVLARYKHWHNRVYPSPPPLAKTSNVESSLAAIQLELHRQQEAGSTSVDWQALDNAVDNSKI